MQETTYTKLCVYGRNMKLLKPKTGYWVFGRGNVNTVTTLVEVRWLEFRQGLIPLYLHKKSRERLFFKGSGSFFVVLWY